MNWQCPKCKSSWPALTTIEAFNNYRRADKAHPKEKCQKPEGK